MKYYEATISLEDRNVATNDWRLSTKSWNEKIQFLYETKYGCDVNIKIKNKEGEEAHRFVLSMSSNVLEKIINSEVFKIPGDATIVFTNISPEVIDIFLNFIYTKNGQPQTSLHAIELYRIAAKLNVPDLKDIARTFIENNLDVSSILDIYVLAENNNLTELQDRCATIIQRQTEEIINEHTILKLDLESLIAILDQPALSIKEIDLFKLIHQWMISRRQSAIRAGCEDHEERKKLNYSLLMRFCFLSMTAQEFCDGPMKSRLLRKSEELAILGHISSKSCVMSFPDGFNRHHRVFLNQSIPPKRVEKKKESPKEKPNSPVIRLEKTPSTYRVYKDGNTPPPSIGVQRVTSVMPKNFKDIFQDTSPIFLTRYTNK